MIKVLQLMKGLLVLILVLVLNDCTAQNLSGQWRGSFNSVGNVVASEGDTEYVLELEIHGAKITGYSYSYFNYPEKRYYVICRLEGTYEAASKSIVVNEEERIKSNTPSWWSDCLQTHILTFMKQGSTEKLVGRWRAYKTAGSNTNGCGPGTTELERRTLTKVAPPKAAPLVKKTTPPAANNTPKTNTPSTTKPKTGPPVAQKTPPKPNKPVVKPAVPKPDASKNNKQPLAGNQQTIAKIPEKIVTDSTNKTRRPDIPAPAMPGFERRAKNVLKTIDIPSSTQEIKVDFYDNGEIDGDTISVFFNNELVLSKKRLTDKPLTLNLQLDPGKEDNEIVMYADNLGAIPPNTALMVATIDGKRHEVYITSTEKSSGTIRFRKKE